MVDVSNRQRQPSGIPQGGEFKKEQKGLDADDLVAPPAQPARPTREQRAHRLAAGMLGERGWQPEGDVDRAGITFYHPDYPDVMVCVNGSHIVCENANSWGHSVWTLKTGRGKQLNAITSDGTQVSFDKWMETQLPDPS